MSDSERRSTSLLPPRLSVRPADEEDSLAPDSETTYELLTFIIADEAYAFPLVHVREILKLKPITPVPRAPFGVLGILSVRGKVTTIIDLRRLLRMPERAETRRSRILLVHLDEEVIGVLVDEVLQVYRLQGDEVELSTMVSGDISEYVTGIGRPKVRGRNREGYVDLVILLDPTSLLRRHHGA